MFSYFRVQGQSMEPFSKEGDFVFVNRFSRLKEGDVAVLRHPVSLRLLLKRIVRKQGERYWFKGDNTDRSSDSRVFGWVSKKHILGRAKVIHK